MHTCTVLFRRSAVRLLAVTYDAFASTCGGGFLGRRRGLYCKKQNLKNLFMFFKVSYKKFFLHT